MIYKKKKEVRSLETTNYGLRTARGFAMLFAVFIAGLMTSIALAIFNITIKEIALAGTGRESQFAFYAADAGWECASYWDIKGGSFMDPPSSGIFCNSRDVAARPWIVTVDPAAESTTTKFIVDFPVADGNVYCAEVTVKKQNLGGGKRSTVV